MTVTPDECAQWVSKLVQIPSVNPLHAGPNSRVTGEAAIAEFLAEQFRLLGASEVVLDPVVDGRPNVYGIFPGHTDRLVAIDVHTDTVTVENMTDPPFDGRIEAGRVWGRGSLDTKASLGVICALLHDWQRSGHRPEPTLIVAGSISEEAGGLLGAGQFRQWCEARSLTIDELIISEPTELHPIHGHKGAIGVQLTVFGESAHSSTPDEGLNAIYGAARIVRALEEHHTSLVAQEPLTEVGTGTLLVAMINGGIAGNVVPDRCTLSVGRRLVPGEDVQCEYDRIVEIARNATTLEVKATPVTVSPDGRPGSPAFYQSADSTLIRLLASATSMAPKTAPFGTNALRYDGFANEKVVFGPGRIEDAHKPTECVDIADLHKLAHAFTAWLRPS
jgi:acetylornithine deacetylase/succinyl-diaminopimelate desuccinylase-like protein